MEPSAITALDRSSVTSITARMRKLIAFDDDTADKLTQLGRDRMATWQELADEAFADLMKKHGIPIDLQDALRKSARKSNAKPAAKSRPARKRTHARRSV
jgi:non-homologous end joining protein Ku